MRRIDLLLLSRALILVLSSFLSIFRTIIAVDRAYNCTSDLYSPIHSCTGNATFELVVWAIVLVLIGYDLVKTHRFSVFLNLSRRLIPFLLLVLVAWLSLLWTLNFPITITKAAILTAALISAIYIGMNYSVQAILKQLAVFFAVISILNFLMVVLFPAGGLVNIEPHANAWRGIFRNKNYLSTFLAYANAIFFLRLLINKNRPGLIWMPDVLFYLFTFFQVVKSESAAGMMILIIMAILTLLLFVWSRIQHRLDRRHYYSFSIVCALACVGLLTNLNWLFGIFNRDTSLTGRILLWQHLFEDYINNRVVLGHGYGVVWSFETVRIGLQNVLKMELPLVIGDNGLIDILLHLGVIGALITVGIVIYALVVTGFCALKGRNLASFFPFIAIIYAILANITLSVFIELDYFVWMMMIIVTVIAFKCIKQNDAKILFSDE